MRQCILGADFGANDDTGKYAADGGAGFYASMAEIGLKQTVSRCAWAPTDPAALIERAMLEVTVAAAHARRSQGGLRDLSVSTARHRVRRRSPESLCAPGSLALLATSLEFGSLWSETSRINRRSSDPSSAREKVSAARFGAFLAAGYDALKSVDPSIVVVGVGLSPRGNDRPNAKSNISTSPVRFLAALGRWYRRSGEDKAADGRLQLPPLPEPGHRPARGGVSVARGGIRQPHPHQAVPLGRLRRHAAADHAGRPQALPRRGGLAGRHHRVPGIQRERERRGHRRTDASGRLSQARHVRAVRSGHCGGQRVRLRRRPAAHRLPGRAPPRRRLSASCRCRRERGDPDRRATCLRDPGSRRAAWWAPADPPLPRRGTSSSSSSPRRKARPRASACCRGATTRPRRRVCSPVPRPPAAPARRVPGLRRSSRSRAARAPSPSGCGSQPKRIPVAARSRHTCFRSREQLDPGRSAARAAVRQRP